MKLRELFNIELLEDMIDGKYVTMRWHPTLPIYILNYTPACAFDQKWNEVTEQCRGLIVDKDTNVISRPMRKFFNLNTPYRQETWYENLPSSKQTEVYEKMDGCMGVVWKYNGQVGVATRGSFNSEMSKWATNHINTKYADWVKWYAEHDLCFPVTYICEIISPVSKIVLDYDFEDLVLLTVIYNDSGMEYGRDALEHCSWPGRIVEKYPYTLDDCLRNRDNGVTKNREGYVVLYRENGLRVKVKFDEYMRLHRLITGVNQKTIYTELLGMVEEAKQFWGNRGWRFDLFIEDKLAEILRDTPEGYQKWYRGWVAKFLEQKDDIIIGATVLQMKVSTPLYKTRSEQAKVILQYPKLSSVTFALLDGNNEKADEIAWKQIKPKVSSEDVYRRDTDN